MANTRKVLQRFNLYTDGVTKLGVARSVTPPDLSVVATPYRGAGMDGSVPIDMGIGGLMFSFDLYDYDTRLVKALGFKRGTQFKVECRAALEEQDGTVEPRIYKAAGMIVRTGPGDLVADDGAGNIPAISADIECVFYEERHNGEEIAYIDLLNNIRRMGGQDRNEALRNAIGGRGGATRSGPATQLAGF